MPRRGEDSDGDSDAGSSSLLNGHSKPSASHSSLEGARWPWVVLGVFLGLLAVLFVPANGGATLLLWNQHAAPAVARDAASSRQSATRVAPKLGSPKGAPTLAKEESSHLLERGVEPAHEAAAV